jgi:hypothetical protein
MPAATRERERAAMAQELAELRAAVAALSRPQR